MALASYHLTSVANVSAETMALLGRGRPPLSVTLGGIVLSLRTRVVFDALTDKF